MQDLLRNMWRVIFYKDRIVHLVSTVGAVASVLGIAVTLLISSYDFAWWIILLLIVCGLLTIVAIWYVFKSDVCTRVYKRDDKMGIRNYMFSWIEKGGRVAIWTRDMSWVDDESMKQMLRRKAESSELIICLPARTELTNYFESHGAKIVAYEAPGSPSSIFTIANYERPGSRVAVGMGKGNLHIIQEFSSADEHPSFYMAYELVKLVQEQLHE